MNTKIRFLGPAVLMLLLVPPMAGAQEPEARIGSAMARAQEAGVPVWLLESKIQEGQAKGVPMERIAQAVEARLNGLSRAAMAMEGAPGGVDAAQLSVGADALGVGVSEAVLTEIAASTPGEHRAVAIAALAHLVQQGTVPAEALARVQGALAQGPAGLANLPGAAGPPFGTPVPGRGGPPEGVQTGPPSWVPAPGQSGPPGPPPGRGPPVDRPAARPPAEVGGPEGSLPPEPGAGPDSRAGLSLTLRERSSNHQELLMKRSIFTTLGAVAVLAITAACDSTPIGSEDTAVLRILLTDAPVDYLEEAWVEIWRIYLIPGDQDPEAEPGEGPPFVELFNNPEEPLRYDVLTLQNGVTADLTGDVEVPAGEYNQLRMVVGASWVTLREPYEFNDGSGATRELFVPSGARTGIKVNLRGAIDAEGGTVNEILVDLDVNQNFVIQGNPDSPAGIQGVLFTPVLRELSRNVEGG